MLLDERSELERDEPDIESSDDSFAEALMPLESPWRCEECFVAELPRSSSFWLPRSVRLPIEPDALREPDDDSEPLAEEVPP